MRANSLIPTRQDVRRCFSSLRTNMESSMGRYQFWIYDKDDEGRPLDETIVKTAEEIRSIVSQYRQQEIDCDSTVNTMLQCAVEAASKASRKNKIRNPKGYLVTVYHRLFDDFFDEQRQWVPPADVVFEQLV